MAITNMFKRYLEDKWPYGGGGCVLISMKNIAPVDCYFPDNATVSEITVYSADGGTYTISAANYDRLYVDFRIAMRGDTEAGPAGSVDYSNFTTPDSSLSGGIRTGRLVPMFVPEGWRLANGLKGCVVAPNPCGIHVNSTSYGHIDNNNLPINGLNYTNILNDTTDVNGLTTASCVCQNKGTESKTFTHIMLMNDTYNVSSLTAQRARFASLYKSDNTNNATYSYTVRRAPADSDNSYYSYSCILPLYYLDEENKAHRLVTTSGGSATFTTYYLFQKIINNIPTSDVLKDANYAALGIAAPIIIEELPSPVTLAPGDAYTITFNLDVTNRENWVRNRSNLEEGILYYSGTMTGQYPTASS